MPSPPLDGSIVGARRSLTREVVPIDAADQAPLKIADRYQVTRPLGQGSFARTLLALDTQTGRQVAIKALHAHALDDWKSYELFERAAAVLRTLRHHGVPEIYDSFRAQWEGIPAAFLVMEYVEGTSMAQLIEQRGHQEPARVLSLFVELLGVLEYLHTRVPPILHRDIKPANVIVRPNGAPALVDFGAVRTVFRPPGESGSTVVGTYGYMAYEQYMGQASPASDLYALGATFLHLVTGRPPSDFMSEAGRLEVPEALACGDPLGGILILARLLRPVPAERFQSARAVREALLASVIAPKAGPEGGTALAPGGRGLLVELPPGPRALTGQTEVAFKRVAHSMWRLMNATVKPPESVDLVTVLLTVFFSIVTIGILPAVFISVSRSRKRRLKPFFHEGILATAEILDMADEDIGFGEKFIRVKYQFRADGRLQRGSDQVLPPIAERWQPGEAIQILYLPERDYDSVIVSTS